MTPKKRKRRDSSSAVQSGRRASRRASSGGRLERGSMSLQSPASDPYEPEFAVFSSPPPAKSRTGAWRREKAAQEKEEEEEEEVEEEAGDRVFAFHTPPRLVRRRRIPPETKKKALRKRIVERLENGGASEVMRRKGQQAKVSMDLRRVVDYLEKIALQKTEVSRLRKVNKTLRNAPRYQKPSRREMQVMLSQLQAFGVSGRKVQHVLAVIARAWFGLAKPAFFVSPSTALAAKRTFGNAQLMKGFQQVDACHNARFFLMTDTTKRAGKMASYSATFLSANGAPTTVFLGYDSLDAETSHALHESLWTVINPLKKALVAGICVDSAAANVGKRGGLGALLQNERGTFIRCDRCERHGLETVARVVEWMWPPVINEPSCTQFIYVCWYVLNDDWPLFRAIMLLGMKERKELFALLTEDPYWGSMTVEEVSEKLTKPAKPEGMRWGTVAGMFLFVDRWLPVLQFAFDTYRVSGERTQGSMRWIAAQWLKWSGSRKLLSHMAVVVEFLENMYVPWCHEVRNVADDGAFGRWTRT